MIFNITPTPKCHRIWGVRAIAQQGGQFALQNATESKYHPYFKNVKTFKLPSPLTTCMKIKHQGQKEKKSKKH